MIPCPKCNGRFFTVAGEDRHCLYCGYVVYGPQGDRDTADSRKALQELFSGGSRRQTIHTPGGGVRRHTRGGPAPV